MDRLIDACRLQVENEYTWLGENCGLYAMEDPFPDFCKFLNLAERRKGVLPSGVGTKTSASFARSVR